MTFSSPLDVGARKTSGFAPRRLLFGIVRPHMGTDWAGPKPGQSVPVYAVASGIVTDAGTGVLAGHTGQIVVIDHGIIGGDKVLTNSGHLASIAVKRGQRVKAGQKIGMMGKTGNTTGVHLHLGVRFNGKYYDPEAWLKRKGITVGVTKPVIPVPLPTTKQLQNRLRGMGFQLVADGVYGEKTKYVVKQYQKVHGLIQDGKWGEVSEEKFDFTVKLQSYLRKQGFVLIVDGYHGPSTKKALKDLATKQGVSTATILGRIS